MTVYNGTPNQSSPTTDPGLVSAARLTDDLNRIETWAAWRAQTQRFDNAFDGKLLFDPLIRTQAVYTHGVTLGRIALFPSEDIFTPDSCPSDSNREGC